MNSINVLSRFRRRRPSSRSLLFPQSAHGLYAMITSAGFERLRSGPYDHHGLRRRRDEFVVLQYTLRGRGALVYEGVRHECSPGTAMLVTIPHDHRYYLPAGGEWTFFYLCMNGREVLRACCAAIGRLGPVIPLADDSPALRSAAETCLAVLGGDVRTPWCASAAAYEIAMGLLEAAEPETRPTVGAKHAEAVTRAVRFCRENLSRTIGVADLAREAGLSRWHFSRLFRAARGNGVGKFIEQERMRAAARLLQTTDEPVSGVAKRCGYAEAAYFCRVFRRTYGLSPGAFRRSGMYGAAT